MDEIRECACRASANPIQQAVNTPRPRHPVPEAVTFGQFARAAGRLGWSPEFLAAVFRGKFDQPKDLLDRIFDRHQRDAAHVIPYASVLAFYHRETARRVPKRRRRPPAVATSFPANPAEQGQEPIPGYP